MMFISNETRACSVIIHPYIIMKQSSSKQRRSHGRVEKINWIPLIEEKRSEENIIHVFVVQNQG